MFKWQPQSLKRKLLLQLSGPLLILLALNGVGSIVIANYIGALVRDEWLLDSALALEQQVKVREGQVVLDLPPAAVDVFQWDRFDVTYAEVESRAQGHLFRNAEFPPPPDGRPGNEPVFYDGVIEGRAVRIVHTALHLQGTSDSVWVQVGETNRKREATTRVVLLIMAPLQIVILAIAGFFIWLAVAGNLRKVDAISRRLSEYDPQHLVPIDDIHLVPLELRPLVGAINHLVQKTRDAQGLHDRFIANAAHQLRTPLAALKIQIQRALREEDPTMLSQALTDAHNAVTRLHHVTHQLLTLMRSERQAVSPRIKPARLDLAVLARDEVERFADLAMSRGIDLGYEGPEHGVEVTGEFYLLRELVSNLLDNAIRYNTSGKYVTLSLRDQPARLRVEDDGPGIPEGERELVLERFYRLRQSESEGCGLGLSIASEIAARHGAQLAIMSNPAGPGVIVEVLFPVAQA